jgi:hypothetical protein
MDYAAHRLRGLAGLPPSWDRLKADLVSLALYLDDVRSGEEDTALEPEGPDPFADNPEEQR